MNLPKGLFTIEIVAATQEQVAGFLHIADGVITGVDVRRVRYTGNISPAGNNKAHVRLRAAIPEGAEIDAGLRVQARSNYSWEFELDCEQLAGTNTLHLTLPTFGSAEVRLRPLQLETEANAGR